MPVMTSHLPGMHCWADLSTSDQDAARKFYCELMGWKPNEIPMGPGETYTMLQVDGKDVAALSKMQPDLAKQGIPPHWMNYIAVKSADDAAAKATSLGAKVVAPPFDVFDSGRMAVLQDPTGGMISVWEPKKHIGAGLYGDVNTLCWTELMTTDTAKAEKFYTGLFGWKAETMPMPTGSYTVFSIDGKNAAGMMGITKEMGPVPTHWATYFAVKNCDDTVKRTASMGGKVLVPPMDIPNVGRFSTLMDPQGAVFSVLQPSM